VGLVGLVGLVAGVPREGGTDGFKWWIHLALENLYTAVDVELGETRARWQKGSPLTQPWPTRPRSDRFPCHSRRETWRHAELQGVALFLAEG